MGLVEEEGVGSVGGVGSSPEVREALLRAEAVATQLPAIRFPTYREVPGQRGQRRQRHRAAKLANVPFVQMVDKIVFSWDGRLLLAIRRRQEPLIYSTDWEVRQTNIYIYR